MEKDLKAKYLMGKKVEQYNTEYAAEYTGIVPMENAVAAHEQVMDDWDALIEKEQEENSGVADDKLTKKEEMTTYWAMMASSARSWALATGHTEEAEDWKRTAPELLRLSDTQAGNACDYLFETINANLASLGPYGITATALSTGQAKTNAFKALIGKPKEEQGEKSAVGVEIDKLVATRFDPGLLTMDTVVYGIQFAGKESFVLGYREMRVIDNQPTQHTTLTVTFIDQETEAPLKNASLRDVREGGKTAMSDVVGVAVLREFKGGKNLEFECSRTGYITQTLVKSIKPGQKVTHTIRLQKSP